MKILITGGAGFIGANLALEIQKRFPSSQITVLDDLSSGDIKNLKGIKGELIEGKVEDEEFINSLKGEDFDFILHQAAITDTTVNDSENMMMVNVGGFRNILELAKERNSGVIYASSAGVYGNGPVPMKESQKPASLNAYALSKVEADKLAVDFAAENRNVKIIGLRYFNVYGPGEACKEKSASMIWQLACQMKEGKNPRIFKYGEQKRDFIYVKDVIEANIKAMESVRSKISNRMEAKEGMIVNIGTGVAISFNRTIEVLNETLGTSYEPEYFDNPYNFYQNYTEADTNLAEQLLGFKARFSVEEGIKDYIKVEGKKD